MDASTGVVIALAGAIVVIVLFAILVPRWSKANKAKPGAQASDKFFEIRKENREP